MEKQPTLTVKEIMVDIISWLFILLFVYAASSKLLDYQQFVMQLGKSPILSTFSNWVALLIPFIEIGTAVLLMFEKFQLKALYASFSLMVVFSTYIIMILHFCEYIPCSCGGILENMSWTQHLWFNMLFVVLGGLAVIMYPIKHKNFT